VSTRPRDVGSSGAAKDIREVYSSFLDFEFVVHEGDVEGGMLPKALKTANVAHALLTVWCAKKPGKSGSGYPAFGLGAVVVWVDEGFMYLNRKIRAWIGWRDARESGSREYRSSTISGRPSVLSSSLWGWLDR
jgi:hypothetical protein